MKKFVILFLLLALPAIPALYAQDLDFPESTTTDSDHFWYVSGGFAAVVPKISLGYRFQKGKFGADISLTEATIPPDFFSQGIQINENFYLNPNIKKEWYFGFSEGIHLVVGKLEGSRGRFWDASLGVLVGYQFRPNERRHFIEGKLGVPILASAIGAKYPIPIPSVAYGVSF